MKRPRHIENIPIENIPIENIPIENIPIENIPIENIPIENIPIEYSVKRRENSTPGAFKRRYSQQLFTDPGMMKRFESIVAERQA
jgi:hypothetical protein